MYDSETLTFACAILLPEWVASMQDKITSIKQNQTWDLVPLHHGARAISCKWVYKIKEADSPVH
jgi:hypothetical protein